MATKYNVFRPSNRVLRAAGGSRSSGGFGSGGESGYNTFIDAITQIRDDRNNREILLGHGHDKEIVGKMNSAQLATTVADYARDDVERDKIKRVDELTGRGVHRYLYNLNKINQAEKTKKPIEALGDLFAPNRLGRVGRPDIRPRDVTDMTDVTPQAHWGPGDGEPGQPPIGIDLEKESVPRGPSIPEFDRISKDAISPPPDYTLTRKNILQALAKQPGSLVEPIDQSAVLLKAMDQAYRLDAEASKERVIASKPTHTSAATGRGTIRGFTDPTTDEFTESFRRDRQGKKVPVLVPPTETITTTNLKKATSKSLDFHQGNIDKNVQLLRDYTVLSKGFTHNMFRDIDRLKQWAIKNLDGTIISPNYKKFPKTPEGKKFAKTLVFMQKVRVLFNRNRKHDTGVAFSPKELEELNKTHLNVVDYGPMYIEATIEGKKFDINGELDLDQNFMKNFTIDKSLYELNVLQRKYAQDVKPFNPAPSKTAEEAIKKFNNSNY